MTSSATSRVTLRVLVREYWGVYGGWRELLKSPYLYIALFLLPLMVGIWSRQAWWDVVLLILPNLLGLSLAAFTLFLGAGSETFRELIAGEDETEVKDGKVIPSPFIKTAVIFLHFLIVQLAALVLALIAKSAYAIRPFGWFEDYNGIASLIFWGISFFFFLYALTVVLAASFGVYEVVRWFDEYVSIKKKDAGMMRNSCSCCSCCSCDKKNIDKERGGVDN